MAGSDSTVRPKSLKASGGLAGFGRVPKPNRPVQSAPSRIGQPGKEETPPCSVKPRGTGEWIASTDLICASERQSSPASLPSAQRSDDSLKAEAQAAGLLMIPSSAPSSPSQAFITAPCSLFSLAG